jgi:hypothetical protein
MLATSVQHAHPRWDSPRGQRHICAGSAVRLQAAISAAELRAREAEPASPNEDEAGSVLCARLEVRHSVRLGSRACACVCRACAFSCQSLLSAAAAVAVALRSNGVRWNAHYQPVRTVATLTIKAALVSRHYNRWRNSCRLCVQPTADADAIIAGLCEPPTVRPAVVRTV